MCRVIRKAFKKLEHKYLKYKNVYKYTCIKIHDIKLLEFYS